ncbi:MAG: GrlR family regulatory protein [Pseudomonadota bacterium]
MSSEGLWSIEIGAELGVVPGGVIVFNEGRLHGGGNEYFYVGSYEVRNDQFIAVIEVTHYNDVPNLLFGEAKGLLLNLTGVVSEAEMDLGGLFPANPDIELTVRLTKRAPL